MENGIATPTKSELRKPKANISTRTTSTSPERMLFSRSWTMVATSSERSARKTTWTLSGQSAVSFATTWRTRSTTSTTLVPWRFWMVRATASWPLMRA